MELVGFRKDGSQHFVCPSVFLSYGSVQYSRLTPLFIVMCHGFTDAICI